jgi:undecaprenyl-phosphate 4-deoxy-4-formamido-L-arabinose transferase
MMTGFSTLPLHLASLIGFAFSIFGLSVLVYVFVVWLLKGSVVPGFAFLASIITLFSGAQLLALGIIGEYLSRMHLRTMERPSYNIAKKTSRLEAY